MPTDPGKTGAQKDLVILQALDAEVAKINAQLDGLYISSPGCSCNQHGLCAFHAQVGNYLLAARKAFLQCIEYIRKNPYIPPE